MSERMKEVMPATNDSLAMNEKPEWAEGPEWEGWHTDKAYTEAVCRSLANPCNDPYDCISIELGKCPILRIGRGSHWTTLALHGAYTDDALKLANTLAEILGGWHTPRPV